MYCETADIISNNVSNLLYAAKKYSVTGLVGQCLDFLESSISIDNVCDILEKVLFPLCIYKIKKVPLRTENIFFYITFIYRICFTCTTYIIDVYMDINFKATKACA